MNECEEPRARVGRDHFGCQAVDYTYGLGLGREVTA